MLHHGLKMSEHEAYWLIGLPLINSWACLEIIMVIFQQASKPY